MDITSDLVKKLRMMTNAGVMNCKQALLKTDGDLKKSVVWLRTKGLADVQKKSIRTTSEGLIAITIQNRTASIIEVNTETDFVSRNEKFQDLVAEISKNSLAVQSNINDLKEFKDMMIRLF